VHFPVDADQGPSAPRRYQGLSAIEEIGPPCCDSPSAKPW
jgi:hypothetical protein